MTEEKNSEKGGNSFSVEGENASHFPKYLQ